MAQETFHGGLHYIALSRKEATDMIGLLVARLAGEPLRHDLRGTDYAFDVTGADGRNYVLVVTLEIEPRAGA